MKKYAILAIICLLLIGCESTKEEKTKPEKKIEKYSLVSTEDRLVFKSEDNYEVVFYENDKIVGVESVIKFKTPEEAENYFKEESYGSSEEIRVVYDVFITSETEDYWEDYENLSREDLKKYMEDAEYEYVSK